jgi:hypothetical protein
MRAAQDRGVAHPGDRLEIVDEAGVAGEQSRVLEALNAPADPLV